MNLLPKTHGEFAEAEYWNAFFKKRGNEAFEWYGEYLDLCDLLHKYVKTKDKILMLGCGNSKLSMDMYDAGFRDIINIDISPVAIKKMSDMNSIKRPDMKFIHMDATKMSFVPEKFSVAIDKGTLDAIFVDDTENVRETVNAYLQEILRTMRNGARYLCISLLQEHILNYVLDFFPKNSCMLRIVSVNYERPDDDSAAKLPVFLLVITKFKALPMSILEFSLGADKLQRVASVDELKELVSAIQKAALVCSGLARGSIAGHDEITMDLFKPGEAAPRYSVYVLDQPPARGVAKYAAFIVPQGREIEWLFSTPQGRRKLQSSAKFQRLAVVTLHRDQNYASLDAVKSELADSIKNLAPQGIKEQIPFLSLGEDVGKRETLITGFSQISGDFRIEEVEGSEGKLFRRLIFLSNQSVVQSEALVRTIKPKNKKERKKIDVGYLACQHHLFMSLGVEAATRNANGDVLIVGLGGGGLCTFLHEALSNIRLTAVEIDPIMLEIAEQFFELKQDKRLHVAIDDGLAFVERCKSEDIQFSAVLFDVDSKDTSLGMSCPPPSFLAENVLENVKHVIGPKGLFILNLVCRDEEMREKALNDLRKTFKGVCAYKLTEDVNEVIFCTNAEKLKALIDWKKWLGTGARSLNENTKKKFSNELVDVTDFLSDLHL